MHQGFLRTAVLVTPSRVHSHSPNPSYRSLGLFAAFSFVSINWNLTPPGLTAFLNHSTALVSIPTHPSSLKSTKSDLLPSSGARERTSSMIGRPVRRGLPERLI